MTLANVSYYIATDPKFVSELNQNYKEAVERKGISLSSEELESLRSFLVGDQSIPSYSIDSDDPILGLPWS